LKAGESASTFVGQNSTQNAQPLQRSTLIATRPFAIDPSGSEKNGNLVAKSNRRGVAVFYGYEEEFGGAGEQPV
jgi:hypothetical protein